MDPRLVRTIVAVMMFAFAMRVIVAAQGNPEAAKMKNPVAATPESIDAGKKTYVQATPDSIAAGQAIYRRRCAGCHGADAKGGPAKEEFLKPASNLVDDQWDHGSTDGEIFNNIKNGIGPDFNMVPFKDQLKDEEIWNLVNYLRSIAKKK